MEDIASLNLKLQSTPQPLTPQERETLQKIQKALRGTNQKNSNDIQPMERPKFMWIERAETFKFTTEGTQTTTPYESSNTIVVDKNSLEGVSSISSAVSMARENSTIIVMKGVYTENIISDKNIHLIGQEGTKLLNSHIEVKSDVLTMKGFQLKSDSDIITISDGTLAIRDSTIECLSIKYAINAEANTSLEINNCTIVANRAIDAASGTIVTINSTYLTGNVRFFKTDATLCHCKLNYPNGICVEASSTNIKVDRCLIQECRDVAFSLREHSSVFVETTEISSINGAGILLHGLSRMTAKNIRILNCLKAGLIITHGASAEVNGSVISDCGLSGVEVLFNAQLTLNETWISDVKGSCVLLDGRAQTQTTRCVITDAGIHGVEAGNGSIVRLKDTNVRNCARTGVLCSSSNIAAQMCEFTGNKEACIFGEDALIELTNCAIVKSKSDGIVTEAGSTLNLNACYLAECFGYHILSRNPKDTKIVESTFMEAIYNDHNEVTTIQEILAEKKPTGQYAILGGLAFNNADMVIIDSCYMSRNMIQMFKVKNGIIRSSNISHAISKQHSKPSRTLEILDDSSVTIESSTISKTDIKVHHAKLSVRKCFFSMSANIAVQGSNNSEMIIENNEFTYCTQIAVIKDNSHLVFSYNNVKNVIRSKNAAKAGETTTLNDIKLQRMKAINVKEFSTGTIEGNFISGDYDYAIYIDGQSKVDCLTNQVQSGLKSGILYAGMSYGRCEENEFSGKSKAVEYLHGFTPQPMT